MSELDQVTDTLYDLCFGSQEPSTSLLSSGTFPKGWPEKYLQNLKLAQEYWSDKADWPKRLAAAVHFAASRLSPRFEAWRNLGEKKDNPDTDSALAKIRMESELFLSRV